MKMIGSLVNVFFASLLLYEVYGAPKSGCDTSSCKKNGLLKYYSELSCTPVYEDDNCCPSKYDCSKFFLQSNDKCHYQGKEYEVQSHISTDETSKHCLAACRCFSNDDKALFNCAQIECPELFNRPLEDPSCYRQYSHDSCCSTETTCLNNTSGENASIYQCEYQGKKFYKGQKIYPKDECKICICGEGYDGSSNEPWCKEFQCNIELLQFRRISRDCVPVFFNSGCCPVDWYCPSENVTVINGPLHKTPISEEINENQPTCKFGNLRMFLHDKISYDGYGNVECTCLIPPIVSCIMKSS